MEAEELPKKRGRPVTGLRTDPLHRARPEIDPRHPVHVILRVAPEINMRTPAGYRAVHGAVGRCAGRPDFRVILVSLQADHLHLLVEADDTLALTRGMQGFGISASKRMNKELGRDGGEVFPYRFHATPVGTPTLVRDAICCVLNNWRHHRADARTSARIDPYSSADVFGGWQRAPGEAPNREPMPVVGALTWLLREGWKRAGLIDWAEVPPPDPPP